MDYSLAMPWWIWVMLGFASCLIGFIALVLRASEMEDG